MKIFSLKVVVPVVLLVLAAAGAFALVETAPKVHKRPRAVIAPRVETKVFARGTNSIRLEVMGTVTAAHKVTLEARVAGEVVSVSPQFVPGGFLPEGAEVLRIDPQDYELALQEMQAEVADAEYSLKVEQGHQNVAAREWNLLKKSAGYTPKDAELALRKPHLAKAEADLVAARAKLCQARLDLERTRVEAPFPAMIEAKSSDVGATVTSQDALADLVGTDEFWVQVSVPVDRLDRIAFPADGESAGAKAMIVCSGDGGTPREGRVIRLLPSLESEGRMARVLVSVKDPLNLAKRPGVKPLLLGSYVTVYIDGGELPDSFAIPRNAFRDNGKIWILTDDGSLDIRDVSPDWRNRDVVLVTQGLAPGERLVVSALPAPVQGMKLRTTEDAAVQLAGEKENRTNG